MLNFFRYQLAAWLIVLALPAAAQRIPSVAAASDLQFALDEVVELYKQQTGKSIRVTYGSSGNFYQQIRQGAPFTLFMSADEDFVFKLADAAATRDRGALYAIGRIVLYTANGSPVAPDAAFSDLTKASQDGRLTKLAIANPEHAPYGRAAKQALEGAGLWSAVERKLVLGENVSQAAIFAASGSVQAGIIALSLATSAKFAASGRYVLIPDSLHAPLRQRMVVTQNADAETQAFYEFLQRAAARSVLKRFGFLLPGESAN
jgi:molybdate transport system substrate-binding protein